MRRKTFTQKRLLKTFFSTLFMGNVILGLAGSAHGGALIGSNFYNNLNDALGMAADGNTITMTSDDSSAGGHIPFTHDTLTITSSSGNTWVVSNRNVTSGGSFGGGVIYFNNNTNSQLNLINISFKDNTINAGASGHGGVISVGGQVNSFTIAGSNSNFTGNKSQDGLGGAIYADKAMSFAMQNTTFTENKAVSGSSSGGAIFVGGNFDFTGSNNTFKGNKAGLHGGALATNARANLHEYFTLSGSGNLFINNIAAGQGGAIAGNYSAVNISGNNNFFHGNQADTGGAINSIGVNISGNNTSFTNNTATIDGGAIYSWQDVTISGNNTYFYGNTAGGITNSIHLRSYSGTNTLSISASGNTFMYDPITSEDGGGGGKIAINKTGAGVLTLGGDSQLHDADWNISTGTLLLTYDSAGNMAQINNNTTGNKFILGSGATLLVVPDPSGARALINSTTVDLQGNVGVGSDLRTASEGSLGNRVLLSISDGSSNALKLTSTSGKFSLGLHDYEYDNLHWENSDKDLVLNVHTVNLNPDRSGGHSIFGPLVMGLNNMSNRMMFDRMSSIFDKVRVQKPRQTTSLAADQVKTGDNLWANTYYNRIQGDADGAYSGYSVNTPGLILGTDWATGERSFFGVALSGAWPEFKQGLAKITGNDIRLNIYGGSSFKNNWEFAYLLGVGVNDYNYSRRQGSDRYDADFDGKNYSAGLYLGKVFEQSENTVIKPFLSYEYLHTSVMGILKKVQVVPIYLRRAIRKGFLGCVWGLK